LTLSLSLLFFPCAPREKKGETAKKKRREKRSDHGIFPPSIKREKTSGGEGKKKGRGKVQVFPLIPLPITCPDKEEEKEKNTL